jgi:hypothetical protein
MKQPIHKNLNLDNDPRIFARIVMTPDNESPFVERYLNREGFDYVAKEFKIGKPVAILEGRFRKRYAILSKKNLILESIA